MIKTDLNIRDSYERYKELSDNPMDIKSYVNLINNYNKFLTSKIFEGYEITLPARFGTMMVTGKKQDIKYDDDGLPRLPVNWPNTWQLWKNNPEAEKRNQKIYFTNEHSDGVRYKFFWSKKRILVSNKNLYSLRMTRKNKRNLAAFINDGKEYYIKN